MIDFEKNGFTALNTAFIGEGVFIYLPKNVKIDAPIQLLFLTDDGKISFPRVLVVAEEFAEATIIETFNRTDETKYLTNSVIEISLADEAKVKHYKVQRESHSAFHVGSTGTEIGRGSVYDATNINLGAKLSRHDIDFKFNAAGGEAFVDGLYMIGGEQHHDTHSVIDHACRTAFRIKLIKESWTARRTPFLTAKSSSAKTRAGRTVINRTKIFCFPTMRGLTRNRNWRFSTTT